LFWRSFFSIFGLAFPFEARMAWPIRNPAASVFPLLKFETALGFSFRNLSRIDSKTKKIKLYIDSKSVPGWNEIDAVSLVDSEGNTQWAKKAVASSTYAEKRSLNRACRSSDIEEIYSIKLSPTGGCYLLDSPDD